MNQNTKTYTNPIVRNWGVIVFCLVFFTSCLISLVLFPSKQNTIKNTPLTETFLSQNIIAEEPVPQHVHEDVPVALNAHEELVAFPTHKEINSYGIATIEYGKNADTGLSLYRSNMSRAAVEWFYTNITENREIALAILEEADKNDIPLSLAFSLAYAESRYKVRAYNANNNGTIDRGLFQLNSSTFPKLTEDDFFNPSVSAKHGLAHLRFCLNTAGNEISALAMYNAGTNRVRKNATPKMTLDYISTIMSYRQGLEKLFYAEVVQFYIQSSHLIALEKGAPTNLF